MKEYTIVLLLLSCYKGYAVEKMRQSEVNSQVDCKCTCNPVDDKSSILYANGKLTLNLQDNDVSNAKPIKLDVIRQQDMATNSIDQSASASLDTKTITHENMSVTKETTTRTTTSPATTTDNAMENMVRVLPPSILSNPTDLMKMSTIDGFSTYYQKSASDKQPSVKTEVTSNEKKTKTPNSNNVDNKATMRRKIKKSKNALNNKGQRDATTRKQDKSTGYPQVTPMVEDIVMGVTYIATQIPVSVTPKTVDFNNPNNREYNYENQDFRYSENSRNRDLSRQEPNPRMMEIRIADNSNSRNRFMEDSNTNIPDPINRQFTGSRFEQNRWNMNRQEQNVYNNQNSNWLPGGARNPLVSASSVDRTGRSEQRAQQNKPFWPPGGASTWRPNWNSPSGQREWGRNTVDTQGQVRPPASLRSWQ